MLEDRVAFEADVVPPKFDQSIYTKYTICILDSNQINTPLLWLPCSKANLSILWGQTKVDGTILCCSR